LPDPVASQDLTPLPAGMLQVKIWPRCWPRCSWPQAAVAPGPALRKADRQDLLGDCQPRLRRGEQGRGRLPGKMEAAGEEDGEGLSLSLVASRRLDTCARSASDFALVGYLSSRLPSRGCRWRML